MSQFITESMVKQFSSNIYHLSQQKDARIWPAIKRKESIQGESKFFDRIGLVEAQEKVGRHSDTTFTDVPYSRRRLTMRDWFLADLVDKEDKLRIIHSPESEYAVAFRAGMARKMDDIAVAGILGTVYTGKEGATPVVMPNSQKIVSVASGALAGMSMNTLLHAKYRFDAAEVDEMDRHLVISSADLRSLLNDPKITSADYAAVKALVAGEINSYMGFNFHRFERLPVTTSNITTVDLVSGEATGGGTTLTAGARRCFAFAGSAVLAGVGQDVVSKVTERADKHYANQVYFNMSLGAMRMEETGVLEILVGV